MLIKSTSTQLEYRDTAETSIALDQILFQIKCDKYRPDPKTKRSKVMMLTAKMMLLLRTRKALLAKYACTRTAMIVAKAVETPRSISLSGLREL